MQYDIIIYPQRQQRCCKRSRREECGCESDEAMVRNDGQASQRGVGSDEAAVAGAGGCAQEAA